MSCLANGVDREHASQYYPLIFNDTSTVLPENRFLFTATFPEDKIKVFKNGSKWDPDVLVNFKY